MAKQPPSAQTVGRNVAYEIKGDKLVLTIDLSADVEPSKSGKTLLVATTEGNKRMGDWFCGISVYKYKDKKVKKS